MKLSYDLTVRYLGNVERVLEAINRVLLDPAVTINTEMTELNYGRSIFQSVVNQIDAVQRQVAARQTAPKRGLFSRLFGR